MRPNLLSFTTIVMLGAFTVIGLSSGPSKAGSGLYRNKVAGPLHDSLYNTIEKCDSALFAAFNQHDLEKLKAFFTSDLEFYHDLGGLTNYTQNIQAFKENFSKNNGLHRELVAGSLEVYPVKDYGAIEIGAHRFCHIENRRQECGTFKFLHIWQKKDGQWKITRVISYGH